MKVDPSTLVSRIAGELQISTSRSSGPGGQNVNKVNSRVTIGFDIGRSGILTPDEKQLLLSRLGGRLSKDGLLQITSQESRSQLQNKEDALNKLGNVLARALEVRKKRRPTRPSKAALLKKREEKSRKSEKKAWRRKL